MAPVKGLFERGEVSFGVGLAPAEKGRRRQREGSGREWERGSNSLLVKQSDLVLDEDENGQEQAGG